MKKYSASIIKAGLLATLGAAVFLMLGSATAGGQGGGQYYDRDLLVKQLTQKHGETPVGLGISGQVIVELFISADASTWTVFVTLPTGKSMLLAAGIDWIWNRRPCWRRELCFD